MSKGAEPIRQRPTKGHYKVLTTCTGAEANCVQSVSGVSGPLSPNLRRIRISVPAHAAVHLYRRTLKLEAHGYVEAFLAGVVKSPTLPPLCLTQVIGGKGEES